MTKQHLNQSISSTKLEAIKFVNQYTFDDTVFHNYLVKLYDYPHPFNVTRPSKAKVLTPGDMISCTMEGNRLKTILILK